MPPPDARLRHPAASPRRPGDSRAGAVRGQGRHSGRRPANLHGSVGGPGYDSGVGRILDLEAWRTDHRLVVREVEDEVAQEPLRRLERAIKRLDGLVARGTGRISSRVESELVQIMSAVTAGRPGEAAERAERLAERLEHPSARAQ